MFQLAEIKITLDSNKIAFISSVLIIIGSLAPWASLSVGNYTKTFYGSQGDGQIILVLALLAIALGLIGSPMFRTLSRVAIGLLIVMLGFYYIANIQAIASTIVEETLLDVRVEYGLYLIVLGGIGMVYGAWTANPLKSSDISEIKDVFTYHFLLLTPTGRVIVVLIVFLSIVMLLAYFF